jgi:hypothetical protein
MDLQRTDTVETYDELILTMCWDDDEDPVEALAGGTYAVCGGEWRREADHMWRFWEDPIVAAELDIGIKSGDAK